MTLISSISGIRGTIGGDLGTSLTPDDIVRFTAAYGALIKNNKNNKTVVIGRDARISGKMVNNIVSGTLMAMGINVIDIGLSTTPTVEIAVTEENADGGIIITASHNPKQWNALKLLNEKGEFLNDAEGKEILKNSEEKNYNYAEVDELGKYSTKNNYYDIHIQKVLDLELVDVEAIKKANFKIVVDAVNSTGGTVIPKLLKALGVENIIELYCTPNGEFPHNPEPLPENLTELSAKVKSSNADLGITVDPDVDRLAFVKNDGEVFGEEYTLVSVADYILQNTKGNTVSNLSSTKALRDITEKHGCSYNASAVGEVNVVKMMKETNAVIGGEGNGGIIYPAIHYGRDSLVGVALFLTFLSKTGKNISELRSSYPEYYISKNKIQLTDKIDVNELLEKVKEKFKNQKINTIDGVKIEFDNEWVHLRKSNTEPIIRVYAESTSEAKSIELAKKIIKEIEKLF
ncbi:MAG: phosphoglucosamine mutase [Bacteroidota bacterium]|nr:phosphoglucosamine mutase [Bacteroidota bacterium]